ncbi:MAG: hypothetical protein R3E33_07295 [Rhodocyclaceae bacterium]
MVLQAHQKLTGRLLREVAHWLAAHVVAAGVHLLMPFFGELLVGRLARWKDFPSSPAEFLEELIFRSDVACAREGAGGECLGVMRLPSEDADYLWPWLVSSGRLETVATQQPSPASVAMDSRSMNRSTERRRLVE